MKGALVVLLCVVTYLEATPRAFFLHIGEEIGRQFENAWTAIKDFIKRPIRSKKFYANTAHEKKTTIPVRTEPPDNAEKEMQRISTEKYSTSTYDLRRINSNCKYGKHCNLDSNTMLRNKATNKVMLPIHNIRKENKVILPIIPAPAWKTMRDWYEVQHLRWGHVPKGDRVFKADEEDDNLSVVDATENDGDETTTEEPFIDIY